MQYAHDRRCGRVLVWLQEEGIMAALSTRFEWLIVNTKLMNWLLGKDQWFQISFTSLHVKWLGSFHLLPLPAARGIVLSQMNILPLYCADAKTSDELKELVHLIKPSLWAYRWHRRTKILLYLIRSRLICYRIWNPTFYHILRLTLSGLMVASFLSSLLYSSDLLDDERELI